MSCRFMLFIIPASRCTFLDSGILKKLRNRNDEFLMSYQNEFRFLERSCLPTGRWQIFVLTEKISHKNHVRNDSYICHAVPKAFGISIYSHKILDQSMPVGRKIQNDKFSKKNPSQWNTLKGLKFINYSYSLTSYIYIHSTTNASCLLNLNNMN